MISENLTLQSRSKIKVKCQQQRGQMKEKQNHIDSRPTLFEKKLEKKALLTQLQVQENNEVNTSSTSI